MLALAVEIEKNDWTKTQLRLILIDRLLPSVRQEIFQFALGCNNRGSEMVGIWISIACGEMSVLFDSKVHGPEVVEVLLTMCSGGPIITELLCDATPIKSENSISIIINIRDPRQSFLNITHVAIPMSGGLNGLTGDLLQ